MTTHILYPDATTGYRLSGPPCAGCPGATSIACGMLDRCPDLIPADRPPMLTAEELRRKRRGERLARLIRDHADQLRPTILEIIVEDIGDLVGRLSHE